MLTGPQSGTRPASRPGNNGGDIAAAASAPQPQPQPPRPRRVVRRRRRRALRWRTLLVIPALLVVLLGVSLVGAAVSPGNVSFEAKWADWLRAHHAGLLAQHFEELYYSAVAPAKGGRPKGLNKVPVTMGLASGTTDPRRATPAGKPATRPTATTAPPRPGLPPPTPVPLVVHPALAGEGKWLPTGPLVHGVPAMYVAQFRADDIYTSQITSAVWIDAKLLHTSSSSPVRPNPEARGRTRPM